MKQYAFKRTILPISILAAGLLVSVLITGSSPHEKESESPAVSSGSGSNLSYDIGDAQIFSSLLSSSSLSINLTERLAGSIIQGVAGNNPEAFLAGADPTSLMGSLDEDTLNRGLSEPLPFRVYTQNYIRVSPDTSKEAQIQYFVQFSKINKAHFGDIPWTLADGLDEWMRNENPEPINRYQSTIPGAIHDLLQLTSPENLVILHLQTLNFWERTFSLHDALLNLDQDPVKFFIALREAPDILDEVISIQNTMEKTLRELVL